MPINKDGEYVRKGSPDAIKGKEDFLEEGMLRRPVKKRFKYLIHAAKDLTERRKRGQK